VSTRLSRGAPRLRLTICTVPGIEGLSVIADALNLHLARAADRPVA
jgi:hypothetical protein